MWSIRINDIEVIKSWNYKVIDDYLNGIEDELLEYEQEAVIYLFNEPMGSIGVRR